MHGVPVEQLDQPQPDLVASLKANKSQIPKLVPVILPSYEEMVDAVLVDKAAGMKRSSARSNLSTQLRESMVWLQWMMFEGDPDVSLKKLSQMSIGQRGVCGAVWGSNDIAYRCRTCEHDPTCAICVPCFCNGNHKDHDYSIIYTGGGCCDCGDATAWRREGFCSKHKGSEQIQPLPEEIANSVGSVLDPLFACWKDKLTLSGTVCDGNPRLKDQVSECKDVTDEFTSVVVETLLDFCKYSDSLLSFVSKRIFSFGLLDVLVRAEKFLSEHVVKKLHELLLKLLGEPAFKYEFGKVYLHYYPVVINEAIKEGNDDVFKKYTLLPTFSVQIFTVPTLTQRLVMEMNLLEMLLGCLGDIFISCSEDDGKLQVTKLGNLFETTLRVIEDVRFVMTHVSVPLYVVHERRDIFKSWLKLLAFVQGMSPQRREAGVEEDNDNIIYPFAICHSFSNIHSLLVAGSFSTAGAIDSESNAFPTTYKQDVDDGDNLVRHAKVGRISLSQGSSVCRFSGFTSKVSELKLDNPVPSSVTGLTFECLRSIENWLAVDNTSGTCSSKTSLTRRNFLAFTKTLSKIRFNLSSESSDIDSNSAGSSVGFNDGAMAGECSIKLESLRFLSLSGWPDITYDVSSEDISVHIPLHRFLSLILQKAFKRCYEESVNPELLITSNFFEHILGGSHPYGFSAYIMEHPLRIRVFCAQVHAGMWRKNGDIPVLSCDLYGSVRWSEQGVEFDLFLLQCCAALAPADLFVNRILERFGLSNYFSLNLQPSSEYEGVLVQEMLTLIIQIVKDRRFSGLTTTENLQRELICKLVIGDATHSQLVKSLPRDLSKVDQLQQVLDTVAVYSNPSGMKQGKYSLRSSYWKELDLYHPRWNPRDLQVAEERYLRFCNTPALTTQLPRWTKVYPPLNGLARTATCKVVLQMIRSVLYYAVFMDKSPSSRAPDGVLLTALHLLYLALDTCSVNQSSYVGESVPVVYLACEEISSSNGKQSLLLLLVLLMRMHKRESVGYLMEGESCNLSSLIESLLKKFAEMDSECLTKLQEVAPEVVNHLSNSNINSDTDIVDSASKHKAKSRERQAAILAKMRAEQSKFMASMNSNLEEQMDGSQFEPEVCTSEEARDIEVPAQYVCSLCHDSNSKNPVSFLVLLQKSRLVSFVNRAPPSWDRRTHRSDNEHASVITNTLMLSGKEAISSTSDSDEVSDFQLEHLVQNSIDEFALDGKPGEVNAFLDFVKALLPSVRNIQVPHISSDKMDSSAYSLEVIEEEIYCSTQREMRAHFAEGDNMSTNKDDESDTVLLGKYIAALSREKNENPSASDNIDSRYDKPPESSTQVHAYDGFVPSDCDGIYLSSCGHAVHQGCLDRYLSSLKERSLRRVFFEGGHIVDPDQGEFLCPVCRGLANSVLPASPGDSKKAWNQPLFPTVRETETTEENNILRHQEALYLLQMTSNMVGNNEILNSLPMWKNGRIRRSLEKFFNVVCKPYLSTKQDRAIGLAKVSHSMLMWDTFKYSLISTEIAARCENTSLTPRHGLDALFKEMKSSNEFVLSLLLKIVHSTRTDNARHVLLRFRGIQLFAGSICSGVSRDEGNMLRILEQVEKEVSVLDIQFWKGASRPIIGCDAFSSLMWILYCLPYPFLSCEESFFSLVHLLYAVSVTQAIITFHEKHQTETIELGDNDCLIADISKLVKESAFPQWYFVSTHNDASCPIKDAIRKFSFPYLRRCALLWKLLKYSSSDPFGDKSSHSIDYLIDSTTSSVTELVEVERLEKMFKIPALDVVIKDESLRSIALNWLNHFRMDKEVDGNGSVLHVNPAVPFRLMHLPYVYHDLLQRYIKQCCPDCKTVPDEPALCLLCGRLCSPNWKSCCSESVTQSHAMACGAGTGIFLLIRKTTILLQRSARKALWPSPYLDAFGEEDLEMRRGRPLYLNEERYAALAYMVASHGLDRSSKVLRQTTIGSLFIV